MDASENWKNASDFLYQALPLRAPLGCNIISKYKMLLQMMKKHEKKPSKAELKNSISKRCKKQSSTLQKKIKKKKSH